MHLEILIFFLLIHSLYRAPVSYSLAAYFRFASRLYINVERQVFSRDRLKRI